jgi:hypothetical protein
MVATINADTTNGVVITSDTSGEIELQANGVTKAKVTANGLQDANGASLRGGSFRNLFINGDMQIAQRNTSSAGNTGNGYTTVDRFLNWITGAGTWTMSQDSDVPSGQGFTNSFKMACTTANASLGTNSRFAILQVIEGQNLQHLKWGTASAESITLSFWIKSNKTGTYTLGLNQSNSVPATWHIAKTFTIDSADTWEKKTLTISGNTATNINNTNSWGLRVIIYCASGSNYTSGTLATSWEAQVSANAISSSNVNIADSTSNYINITGVQLEVGSGASDFEHLPYDVQLARCLRYYWRPEAANKVFGCGYVVSTTRADMYSNFPVPMRSSPSIVNTSVSIRINYAAVSTLATTITLLASSTTGFSAYITGATGLTVGQGVTLANNGVLEFSAEL